MSLKVKLKRSQKKQLRSFKTFVTQKLSSELTQLLSGYAGSIDGEDAHELKTKVNRYMSKMIIPEPYYVVVKIDLAKRAADIEVRVE